MSTRIIGIIVLGYVFLLGLSCFLVFWGSPATDNAGDFAKLLTVATAAPSGLATVVITLYVAHSSGAVSRREKERDRHYEILHEAHGALMSYFRALDYLQSGHFADTEIRQSDKEVQEAEKKIAIHAPECVHRYYYKVWQRCTYIAEMAHESGGLNERQELWHQHKKNLARKIKKFRRGYLKCIRESA